MFIIYDTHSQQKKQNKRNEKEASRKIKRLHFPSHITLHTNWTKMEFSYSHHCRGYNAS